MDVHSASRGKPRNTTLLAATAAGLALAAIGWTVGLLPGSGDGGGLAPESPAALEEASPAVDSADADHASIKSLGAAPEDVVADCNRFAAQVQNSPPDVAAGVPTGDAGSGRTQAARSAYRNCMLEHGFGD